MGEMVERVARALCEADGHDPNAKLDSRGGLLEGFNTLWKLYEDRARAAIEAMREPTAEMLSAAAPFPQHLVIERADVDYTSSMAAATAADRMAARSQYQTMIDAGLR